MSQHPSPEPAAPQPLGGRPRFVVIEDGWEYIDRFTRFLGDELEFVRAADFAAALALASAPAPPAGLLLDLDFRRAPPEALVDEQGLPAGARSAGERRSLAEMQGILILRALRAARVDLPAFLFADLADDSQRLYLEETLAPVKILGSSAGMAEIRGHLRAAAAAAVSRPRSR